MFTDDFLSLRIFSGGKTSTHLSPEEIEIRKKEDELFDKLKEPPEVLEGVMDVLGDEAKSDAVAMHRISSKKRKTLRDDQMLSALKNAAEGQDQTPSRKKGRPRKANSKT
jgi:hypothetical protein